MTTSTLSLVPPESIAPSLILPQPPEWVLDDDHTQGLPAFARCRETEAWLRAEWIEDGGFFYQGEEGPFSHLAEATIGVLWTNVEAPVAGTGGARTTAGLTEMYTPRPGRKWIMARQDAQMHAWFGPQIPDFIITLSAQFWASRFVSLARKLSLATHELCHCGQKMKDGEPQVYRTGPRRGRPVLCVAPHPVEEFPLVVRWFGAAAAGRDVQDLVAAANSEPLYLGAADAAYGCGTCAAAA